MKSADMPNVESIFFLIIQGIYFGEQNLSKSESKPEIIFLIVLVTP